jgi:hypothetical protein
LGRAAKHKNLETARQENLETVRPWLPACDPTGNDGCPTVMVAVMIIMITLPNAIVITMLIPSLW